jgi:hypothetical protein
MNDQVDDATDATECGYCGEPLPPESERRWATGTNCCDPCAERVAKLAEADDDV